MDAWDRKPPRDLFPTEDEIAERAFELCFSERDASDDPSNYLDTAEEELLDRAARRALLPMRSRRRR